MPAERVKEVEKLRLPLLHRSCKLLYTSAYVSIRQHTSAFVSIRQHSSAYVSTRQSYVSIRQHTSVIRQHTLSTTRDL